MDQRCPCVLFWCVQDREAAASCLRTELVAAQEEAAGWQRRCKQLQGEFDGRELELARRDLQSKVRGSGADGGGGCSWVAEE